MARNQAARPALLHRDSDLTGLFGLVYGRRSKPDPKNPGKSTTDQVTLIGSEFDRRGILAFEVLIDEGIGASVYSAKKVRAAFERIIELIKTEPRIRIVGLWEMSRATRRLAIYGQFMELLEERNCLLIVGDRVYDPSNTDDQMALGIGAVMATAETSRQRQRTLRGVASAAQAGKQHGRIPYGMRRIYDEHTRRLVRIEEDAFEVSIIREMARRVLAGESSTSISKDLNTREVPRPQGGKWSPMEVRDTLLRPVYAGRRLHLGVDVAAGDWPVIFDPETVGLLKREFQVRGATGVGSWSSGAKYLLTGLVRCAHCDARMYATYASAKQKSRDKVITKAQTYRCNQCHKQRNMAYLDAYVTEFVNAKLADHDALRAFLMEEADMTEERKSLLRLRAELDQLEGDLEAGEISPKAFTISEKRLTKGIEALEGKLQEQPHHEANLNSIKGRGITSLDDLATLDDKRELLKKILLVFVYTPSTRGPGFDATTIEFRRPDA